MFYLLYNVLYLIYSILICVIVHHTSSIPHELGHALFYNYLINNIWMCNIYVPWFHLYKYAISSKIIITNTNYPSCLKVLNIYHVSKIRRILYMLAGPVFGLLYIILIPNIFDNLYPGDRICDMSQVIMIYYKDFKQFKHRFELTLITLSLILIYKICAT